MNECLLNAKYYRRQEMETDISQYWNLYSSHICHPLSGYFQDTPPSHLLCLKLDKLLLHMSKRQLKIKHFIF